MARFPPVNAFRLPESICRWLIRRHLDFFSVKSFSLKGYSNFLCGGPKVPLPASQPVFDCLNLEIAARTPETDRISRSGRSRTHARHAYRKIAMKLVCHLSSRPDSPPVPNSTCFSQSRIHLGFCGAIAVGQRFQKKKETNKTTPTEGTPTGVHPCRPECGTRIAPAAADRMLPRSASGARPCPFSGWE